MATIATTASDAAEVVLGPGEKVPPGMKPDLNKKANGIRSGPIVSVSTAVSESEAEAHDPSAAKMPMFMFGEHEFLGDSISLWDRKGNEYIADSQKLVLPNGLQLSYGQVNALGGDFYGPADPISDGDTLEERQRRFLTGFGYLATDTVRQPGEAENLVATLAEEVRRLKAAHAAHQDPSTTVYNSLPDAETNAQLEYYTATRPWGQPGYISLLATNWDHFGARARAAYVAGHSVALRTAHDDGNLELAYAQNAFADHFLEDSFSAGHVRTPRKGLHHITWIGAPNPYYDLCAEDMHNEEDMLGLKVTNANNDSWTMYGDTRLLDHDDSQNYDICQKAVQASAKEVWEAWQAGERQRRNGGGGGGGNTADAASTSVPQPDAYAAMKFLPDLAAAAASQDHVPLFKEAADGTVLRRRDIFNRHLAEFIADWTAFGTHESIAWASESDYH